MLSEPAISDLLTLALADFIELLDIDFGNLDCLPSPFVKAVVAEFVAFVVLPVSRVESALATDDEVADVNREDLGGEDVDGPSFCRSRDA